MALEDINRGRWARVIAAMAVAPLKPTPDALLHRGRNGACLLLEARALVRVQAPLLAGALQPGVRSKAKAPSGT